MITLKQKALEIWKAFYGDAEQAEDYSGRVMFKELYADPTSKYGWALDYLEPEQEQNPMPTNIITKKERSQDFTFWANRKLFQIKKAPNPDKSKLQYEIICVIDDDEDD